MAFVHNDAARIPVLVEPGGPHKEASHILDGSLRRREADPCQPATHEACQPLHAERQVGTPPVVRHRMDLVHDQRARGAEHTSTSLRREEEVE